MASLTVDQAEFLEECKLEFSDRFTDADLEYKKIYDLGIPSPPILYPYMPRGAHNRERDRTGPIRHERDNRGERDHRYRDWDRSNERNYNNFRDRSTDQREAPYVSKDRRFRPY